MEEVYKFDKGFEDRLKEYLDMFPNEKRSVLQIQKEWSFFIELAMNTHYWYAIWKIPRLNCELFKIPFPTVVLVYTEGINFKDLTADVKIVAVKDEGIHLPKYHIVKLVQLWPTLYQHKLPDHVDMTSIADALDKLRFFYNHILLPWDYNSRDQHWLDRYLESRLQLYYDIRSGVIPRRTAEYLNSLLSEVKLLQAKLEMIEAEIENESGVRHPNDESKNEFNIIKIQVRILLIKNEFELLENPLWRKNVLEREKRSFSRSKEGQTVNWLVFPEGKKNDYVNFLNDVEVKFGREKFKFSTSLISAVHYGDFNDTFVLSPEKHEIEIPGALEGGGSLMGLYEKDKTTVFTKNDDRLLEFSGENLIIENLTLDASSSQYALIIRHGKVTLKNCKISGNFGSFLQKGITVMQSAEVELVDCEISGFTSGIVGDRDSTIVVKNCEIFSVNIGIDVTDFTKLVIQKANIYNCYECGIRLESEYTLPNAGSFSILSVLPAIDITDTTGKNNNKGDAVIEKKLNIELIQDCIHSDSASNENMNTSDLESADLNNTVIENECVS